MFHRLPPHPDRSLPVLGSSKKHSSQDCLHTWPEAPGKEAPARKSWQCQVSAYTLWVVLVCCSHCPEIACKTVMFERLPEVLSLVIKSLNNWRPRVCLCVKGPLVLHGVEKCETLSGNQESRGYHSDREPMRSTRAPGNPLSHQAAQKRVAEQRNRINFMNSCINTEVCSHSLKRH